MSKKDIVKLAAVFRKEPSVKLAYLFGSQITGKTGPLSDYDFAVYLDGKGKKKMFDIKLELLAALSKVLKTDEIDLVVLNTTAMPELKYGIISEGQLIFEREPFKVLVEPMILNEYFDFYSMLKKYNLTKA